MKFATSVAASHDGNTIVVGTPLYISSYSTTSGSSNCNYGNSTQCGEGMVRIYEYNGTSYDLQETIIGGGTERWGEDVDISYSGDTVVFNSSVSLGQICTRVWVSDAGGWYELTTIITSGTLQNSSLSLTKDGTTIFVQGRQAYNIFNPAVHVYNLTSTSYTSGPNIFMKIYEIHL